MEWFINNCAGQYSNEIFTTKKPLVFHQSLEEYKPTPLVELESVFSELGIGQLLVKDESQRMGLKAFKCLGASYAIARYNNKYGRPRAFCTATDGNHGRAVAWAAQKQGIPAFIFMPHTISKKSADSIRSFDATVEITSMNYDETVTFAMQQAEKHNWALIQDTSWNGYKEIPWWIMEGYMTQLEEIRKQINEFQVKWPDIVFLQSGVGSWAASVIWYFKTYLGLATKIILVEPISAAGAMESVKQGRRVTPQGNFSTMMAGLNCGIPSALAWPILRSGVDVFIAIEDKWCLKALDLLKTLNIIDSGPSGAAGLAGLWAVLYTPGLMEKFNFKNSSILLFNTEGNILSA